MNSYQGVTNIFFHLGSGTFETDVSQTWTVQDGWTFEGAGMYSTTIKMVGAPAAGGRSAFKGVYNQNRYNVSFRDFTVDCNWPELANKAPDGAIVRTFTTTAASSSSPTIISTGQFTVLDIGRRITGDGIPADSWIGAATSDSIAISSSPVDNVPVNVNVAAGEQVTISEKNVKLGAITCYGANNFVIERVRAIHSYGSGANSQENFVIGVWASALSDGDNNRISRCIVEDCYGNYGTPYMLSGFRGSPSYPGVVHHTTNSRVEFCTATGRPGPVGYQQWTGTAWVPLRGSVSPFTSGGVNLADVKNVVIDSNTFTDCQSIAYLDTGGYDGVQISSNTLYNGWIGIGLNSDPTSFPDAVFANVTIIGNQIGIQRRVLGGANYAFVVNPDPFPYIASNTVVYDPTGPGNDVFWGMLIRGTGGTIINNLIDGSQYAVVGDNGVVNDVPDSRYSVSNNRTSMGALVPGVLDTASPTPTPTPTP
jgi:hypothetical protein